MLQLFLQDKFSRYIGRGVMYDIDCSWSLTSAFFGACLLWLIILCRGVIGATFGVYLGGSSTTSMMDTGLGRVLRALETCGRFRGRTFGFRFLLHLLPCSY